MVETYQLANPVLDMCLTSEKALSKECIIKNFCPQLSHYFVNTGIIIIALYIAVSWVLWWYMKKGYMKYPLPNTAFYGDINRLETRVYWDNWVKTRLTKLLIGFIVVVIYLNW